VAVIGAALDLGQGRRGVDMGPSAIRYGGLVPRLEALGHDVRDRGNLSVEGVETLDVGAPEARYLDAIMRYGERLAAEMVRCVGPTSCRWCWAATTRWPSGSSAASARAHGDTPGGLLWLDAHGDLNVPGTSPSGNVHGMPLAAALGHAPDYFASDAWPLPMISEAQTTLLGVRSSTPPNAP
jgi:arginase